MPSLSIPQAQKLALLSQGLPSQPLAGNAYQQSIQAMRSLGYVQIDTISVVQRAHHHTLWSRNHRYSTDHLDRMVQDRVVYEYWSHAASYLDMQNYRFSLPKKHALKSGQQSHWFKKNPKLMAEVLSKITIDGPQMAKDFTQCAINSTTVKKQGWESKPTKQALETLYMQGDLMISERRKFHKVYDLTERVLTCDTDTRMPTADEHAQFLVLNTLKTHGIANVTEMSYLRKGTKPIVQKALYELEEMGKIEQVTVKGEAYFVLPQSLELLDKRISRQQAKLLSPFDSFIIQRDRLRKFFNFDYLLECYVPTAKREYGYFVLPILWDGRLVARVDCKAHRDRAHLEVFKLYIEPRISQREAFEHALAKELTSFALFNHCDSYNINKTIVM
ncbi:winged helix-turn-helix domain-containing protein [Vibrio sp. 10N]|uniref:winged helix-turn-helix domain-containing protein n=1 Tax=Vibrio sp. 10N TaxID=3058938 RepID=UPI002812A40D|nr:crosslink repair DNA glycosylase YcaQ family protein [Vibrio sp. 10N]